VTTPASAVELRGVSKSYGTVQAVRDLSLVVPEGSFTTLLGPSGCGKTTALRMVAGFIDPDRGDVLIGGKSQLGVPSFRRRAAMVFQDFALFPHMTVATNIGYGLRHRRMSAGVRSARVAEVLAFLQLEAQSGRHPHELSGGQQQRVALGRALAVRPEVLLMDEPLSNLDAKLRVRLRAELRSVQRELGLSTVHVTHDQEEALAISDQVAVMSEGAIRQVGPPRELYEQPADRFVADVMGETNYLEPDAVEREGDATFVWLDGQRLVVRDATDGATAHAVLLVRPEWFSLTPCQGATLPVSYLGSEYRGASEFHSFRLPGGEPVGVESGPGSSLNMQAGAAASIHLGHGRALLTLR